MQTFLIGLLSVLFFCCSAQDVKTLAEKFRTAADYQAIRADFIQTRTLKELDMQVEIKGEMINERNGRLRWHVKVPFQSITLIGLQTLEHYESGKTVAVGIRQLPPGLAILRECFSEWISGDPDRLSKRFELAAKDDHTLRLIPKETGLKEFFRSVEIRADAAFSAVECIRIEESSGDLLEIRFRNVVKNPPLNEEIWKMPGK